MNVCLNFWYEHYAGVSMHPPMNLLVIPSFFVPTKRLPPISLDKFLTRLSGKRYGKVLANKLLFAKMFPANSLFQISNYKVLRCLFVCLFVIKIQIFQSQFSSGARNHASEASMPPAGARIFKGPVGPLKFQQLNIVCLRSVPGTN